MEVKTTEWGTTVPANENDENMKLSKEIIEQLDEEEFFLASRTHKSIAHSGLSGYLHSLTFATYHIAREVAKMSPNERIIFDDALKRFEAVQGGSK